MRTAAIEEIADLVITAGEIMLRNGAETSRIEQTMQHIAQGAGVSCVETFVIPTGIFITVANGQNRSLTTMRRIQERTTNLDRIAKVNELSRRLATGQVSCQDGIAILQRISRERTGFSWKFATLASGIIGASYALLLQGGAGEMILAFTAAALARVIAHAAACLPGLRFTFTYEFFSAMAAATIGVSAAQLWPTLNRDIIVVGGILPLVPGVAITNAISDIIAGDLLSGMSRGLEAVLTSAAVAMGVIIVLSQTG